VSAWLTSVVDALDGALLVTVERKVELANQAARRMWGARIDWPVPEPLAAVIEPGLHELVGDGDRRFSAHSVPFGSNGSLTILTDITDQVQAQVRLARSERLATVGQMLAQITHEIRNPLNALSLNVEMLRDDIAEHPELDDSRSLVDMVSAEVERLTALSGHYLALARRPEPRPLESTLDVLVAETLRLVGPELRACNVAHDVEVDAQLSVWVDPDQLRQALLNVLRNALQAHATRVQVRAGTVPGGAWLEVADDGEGMDAVAVRQATEPFFSTKPTGSGLGLSITRQILEDHGGRLSVTSVLGEGTTVRIELRSGPPQAKQTA
jgi:signal transduction histidine kinase